ncbi:unnamed protein product [Tuber melanosporum]|uniref:(Perigord truffle) hypothetical protein n=1 Tax=Tuber melanosporum (strain Mel28) TaxID=656061 RepID=D5GM92_TUBMM|nr:uncharacterized protein GSTUM_00010581001 [Tuber melanosporum]CAZ85629.1 unnamed protein product [Tuber melanosporum]
MYNTRRNLAAFLGRPVSAEVIVTITWGCWRLWMLLGILMTFYPFPSANRSSVYLSYVLEAVCLSLSAPPLVPSRLFAPPRHSFFPVRLFLCLWHQGCYGCTLAMHIRTMAIVVPVGGRWERGYSYRPPGAIDRRESLFLYLFC